MNPFKKNENPPDIELFTIFDSKSKSYREPIAAKNQFVLMRELQNLFRSPEQAKNQLVTNAEDFALFKIGEYSLQTGQVTSFNMIHIANLHDLKAADAQDLG